MSASKTGWGTTAGSSAWRCGGLVALVLGPGLSATAEAAFAYRKPLTIQGARVSGAPHTSFPVLISQVDPNLRTLANGGRVSSANGYDIAFMLQSTGARLDHEIESYDGTTGTLVAWVRIPSLTAADQTVFIYYGDPEIRCAQNASPTAVWDANYVGVWHLKEDPSSSPPQVRDSTTNANHGTTQGAMTGGDQIPGQIDGSLDLDGVDDYVAVPDANSLDISSSFTLEAWARWSTVSSNGYILEKGGAGPFENNYYLWWNDNTVITPNKSVVAGFSTGAAFRDVFFVSTPSVGQWHHVVTVFDDPANQLRTYFDGVQVASNGAAGSPGVDTGELRFGRDSKGLFSGDVWWNGALDEIRVSNALRSAGWIQTTYNNASCPATSTCGVAANRFVVEGAEQVVPTNYRSIGDTTTPYSTGSVTAVNGSPIVLGTGTAWRTANRGRGDSISFGGFTGTILSVDSETQLTLVSASTVGGSFPVYSINRKFADLASWEDCIDGGSSPCGPDPVIASGNFVTGDRREVGIVYKDKLYVDTVVDGSFDVLLIDGSTTALFHTITLTADPGNRHNGIPGSGVVLDMGGAADGNGIYILDNFATVEWMEVRNAVSAADGVQIGGVSGSNRRVVRNCILHDVGSRGIQIHTNAVDSYDMDIYNNFIYRVSRGIFIEDALLATSSVRILNNTVFACTSGSGAGIGGVAPVAGTPVTLSNNISHSNAAGSFGVLGLNPASSNNLASDLTGITHSPGGAGLDSVPLAGAGGVNFINTAIGSENLHLRTSAPLSAAQDAGADLSCFQRRDIDGLVRLTPWEIGADDVNLATAVTLQSFSASGADSAVDLAWTTASELENLGFHIHRGASADGPFERITSSLIPGLGSSPTGASYGYRDSGLVAGQTYYYRLEDVETTGRTERHGPVWAVAGTSDGAGTGCQCDSGGSAKAGGSGDGTAAPDATARISHGRPDDWSFRVLSHDARSALVELMTPGFYSVAEEDGSLRLEIPGFDSRSVPGAPAVPVLRTFVEAVAGRRVRILSVVASDEQRFHGLRLATAEAPELRVSHDGTLRPGRAKRRGFVRSVFPRTWAQLLEVAFQGETKKVRVELAPLRYDPRTRTAVLARRLRVRLGFDGVERGERGLGGSRGRRPRPAPTPSTSSLVAELVTREAGLQAVRFEDVFTGRRGVSSANLRLAYQGQAVAHHLEPAGASFGPGSMLFFVSGGAASNPWGDAVYTLETGSPGLTMASLSAAPSGPPIREYLDRKDWEQNRTYQAGLLEASDLWLWDSLVSPVTKSYPFTLAVLSPSATPAHLTVRLQGASDFEAEPDHHVRVLVNGTEVGEASWDGKTERAIEAELGPGILQEGTNTLSLENVGDTAADYSMVFLDGFSLRYPRRLVAESGQLQGSFAESGTAEVGGLGAYPFVLETRDQPRWLTALRPTATGVAFRAEAGRSYLAASSSGARRPTVRKPVASGLRSPQNRADWILIAPREFLPAAQPLVELRRIQGLRVSVATVEEIDQEFGYGESRPAAVKAFLEHAYANWQTPSPRYVLLLGDGSYDPKGYLKTGRKDRIPADVVKTSYLWTASDPAYGAVNGEDLLPDLAVGRLSAGTLEEARVLVEKVVAFEAAGRRLDGKAVLVADNADTAGSFEADADEIAATVLRQRDVERIYLRDLGASSRPAIVAAFDDGPALVSYVGHGGTAVWASENIFNNWDIPSLSPQAQQPLLLTMNCLNGFFHHPSVDSLAEALVKVEGRGAVAAFSPSGLSLNDAAHVYHKALLAEIESGRHARLGDAVLAAQAAYADSGAFPELLSIYQLLGDPGLRIR
jgi:hypothetical protein